MSERTPDDIHKILSKTHWLEATTNHTAIITRHCLSAYWSTSGTGLGRMISTRPTTGQGLTPREALEDVWYSLRLVWPLANEQLQVSGRPPKVVRVIDFLADRCEQAITELKERPSSRAKAWAVMHSLDYARRAFSHARARQDPLAPEMRRLFRRWYGQLGRIAQRYCVHCNYQDLEGRCTKSKGNYRIGYRTLSECVPNDWRKRSGHRRRKLAMVSNMLDPYRSPAQQY